MIKTIVLAGALFLLSLHAGAQDMKTLFINMPDSLSPLFTKVNRADFADFLESNMKAQVKNRFDKKSEMKVLTKDYLLLEISPQSTLEMKLLPLGDTLNVICMVKTVCGPACDSHIRFFDTSWKELPAPEFVRFPGADAFYQPADSTDLPKYEQARRNADILLTKATLSSKDRTLTFVYTTPDYLDKESAAELRKFLRKDAAIVYRWEGGMFKE